MHAYDIVNVFAFQNYICKLCTSTWKSSWWRALGLKARIFYMHLLLCMLLQQLQQQQLMHNILTGPNITEKQCQDRLCQIILERFLQDVGRFLGNCLGEFAVQPTSSNLLSKKACLHKFVVQKKARIKNRGPAVFAAGVGN